LLVEETFARVLWIATLTAEQVDWVMEILDIIFAAIQAGFPRDLWWLR
jgi:hypothetical protein